MWVACHAQWRDTSQSVEGDDAQISFSEEVALTRTDTVEDTESVGGQVRACLRVVSERVA